MRQSFILMYMGTPIIVCDDSVKLHDQAIAEARLSPDRTHPTLGWNGDGTRLFRSDEFGHPRFTGYEVRKVVRA